MRTDYDEAHPLAGLLHPEEGDGDYGDPVEAPDSDGDSDAAGILAPLREPRTGLRADISRLAAAIRSRHDWQPPSIRAQREAADQADPHQRWVGGPATGILLTLLLILHDRGHSRAAAALAGGTAVALMVIVVLLLTHKGA
jgi:hypothetical protein